MKIKLTKPGGFLTPNSQVVVETTQIAAMQVNDDSHTELTLLSGAKIVVVEAVDTVEKLCVETIKQMVTPEPPKPAATPEPPKPAATPEPPKPAATPAAE